MLYNIANYELWLCQLRVDGWIRFKLSDLSLDYCMALERGTEFVTSLR